MIDEKAKGLTLCGAAFFTAGPLHLYIFSLQDGIIVIFSVSQIYLTEDKMFYFYPPKQFLSSFSNFCLMEHNCENSNLVQPPNLNRGTILFEGYETSWCQIWYPFHFSSNFMFFFFVSLHWHAPVFYDTWCHDIEYGCDNDMIAFLLLVYIPEYKLSCNELAEQNFSLFFLSDWLAWRLPTFKCYELPLAPVHTQ